MALTSPQFIFFAIGLTLVFNLPSGARYRIWILSIANATFLLSFVPSATALLPLAFFLATGYVSLKLSAPGRPLLNGLLLLLIILMFVYLKRYAFLGPIPTLPFPYLGIGLSYILFRMLQLVIDRSYGEGERNWTVHEFFDFTCNFLCFISGPIQRSADFLEDQERIGRMVDTELAYRSFRRIIIGYIKVAVVSGIANYVFTGASQRLFASHGADLIQTVGIYSLSVASYTTYLFFNFSGYMDIVIGLGWLLGQELPENFNRPFKARNLFEFWARWHMTLSEWFKTYLFNPLLGSFASRITHPRAMTSLGVLAFFVTFFVMGVWHGSTLVFVIYGLVMGAGVSINKVWQIYLLGRMGKKRVKALSEKPLYGAWARGITISFFSIAVTALWIDWAQLHFLVSTVGTEGVLITFVLLAILSAIGFPLFDWIEQRGKIALAPIRPLLSSMTGRQAMLGASVLFILAVSSFFHKAPEFVYKAF